MSKRAKLDITLGLMFSSGFILLISSLPVGIALALQMYYQEHFAKHDAIFVAIVMTGATAIIGAILLVTAEMIFKRRRKLRDRISV